MPTYEYRCESCGTTVEVFQSFSEAPLSTCATCGGALRKVYAPVGIVFKGSGFYKTDSRTSSKGTAKSNSSSPDAAASAAPDAAGGSDTKKDGVAAATPAPASDTGSSSRPGSSGSAAAASGAGSPSS